MSLPARADRADKNDRKEEAPMGPTRARSRPIGAQPVEQLRLGIAQISFALLDEAH